MRGEQSIQSINGAASTDAFSTAIQFFHDQLDHDVDKVATATVETPREYFTDVRGWSEETVESLKLGYAPKSTRLKTHLQELGYDDEELLSTGLFTELDSGDISCLFKGRYVFPYYDEAGEPAYAIARQAGDHSTLGGKYVKCATSTPSEVQEPIFGIHEFDPDNGCWIVEGMADAITALEQGLPVLSPVTTQFKQKDRERVLSILEEHDIENVMVVADNDEAGIQGAVSTATFLSDSGYDAYVTTPPEEREDLDGYVDSRADFEELTDQGTPIEEHDRYDENSTQSSNMNGGTDGGNYGGPLSDLTIPEVETSLSAGDRGRNPLSHSGSRKDYFVVSDDGRLAYDHKKKVGYNAITYLLCDIGKRSPDSPNGELSNDEIQAVGEAASNRGLISDEELSSFQSCYDGREQAIALPEILSPSDREWQDSAGSSETALTLAEAYTRCQRRIDNTLRSGAHTLIDALPAMGKSSGVIRGAAKADTPISVFTARHDLYKQYCEWCEDENLTYYQLPSFHEDCPTASGEYSDEWKERVRSLYRDDVMPREIHQYAKQYFGEPLPCDDGQECPYKSRWDTEFEDYDVVIGHYTHSYSSKATTDRVAVFDEFPADSFLVRFDGDTVASAVSAYLSKQDDLPFRGFTELIEGRSSEQGEAARDWFDPDDLERDGKPVLMDESGSANAYAPLLTYAVLAGENLGNGWEHTDLGKEVVDTHRKAARDRDSGEVSLLLPPALDDADGVIGLDGTPTPTLWQLVVDTQLNHKQVLSDEERAGYLTHALGYNIVQTTGSSAYSYSGGGGVKPERDGLLFEAVAEREETAPALISTAKAISQYEQAGVLAPISKHEHYGNLKGSNQFENERVGIVAGSRHYGDDYVKRWGAFADKCAEADRDEGRGMDLSYGEFGDKVLHHMREHEVLQAALRFGRDGDGANIYVHTAALPEWVPVETGGHINTWSKGTEEIIRVLEGDASDRWRTSGVAEQVDISKRQVRTNLTQLADAGYVEKEREGRGYTWVVTDEAIDRLGQVEFRSS